MSIGGTYKVNSTTLELDVNKQALQQLSGIENWDITKVTFNYTLNEDNLILILNWAHIRPLLEDFMETSLFNELAKDLISPYIPTALQGLMETIIGIVKTQVITNILNDVEKLEGTFTLKKV